MSNDKATVDHWRERAITAEMRLRALGGLEAAARAFAAPASPEAAPEPDDSTVTCEACSAAGHRRRRTIAPTGWLFMETADDDTGAIIVTYACSPRCALALWKRGPGRLDLASKDGSKTKDSAALSAFPEAPCGRCGAPTWFAMFCGRTPCGLADEPPAAPPQPDALGEHARTVFRFIDRATREVQSKARGESALAAMRALEEARLLPAITPAAAPPHGGPATFANAAWLGEYLRRHEADPLAAEARRRFDGLVRAALAAPSAPQGEPGVDDWGLVQGFMQDARALFIGLGLDPEDHRNGMVAMRLADAYKRGRAAAAPQGEPEPRAHDILRTVGMDTQRPLYEVLHYVTKAAGLFLREQQHDTPWEPLTYAVRCAHAYLRGEEPTDETIGTPVDLLNVPRYSGPKVPAAAPQGGDAGPDPITAGLMRTVAQDTARMDAAGAYIDKGLHVVAEDMVFEGTEVREMLTTIRDALRGKPAASPLQEGGPAEPVDEGARCCGCEEPRPENAHALGWRFQTCSDAEPRWLCPTCQEPATDAEGRVCKPPGGPTCRVCERPATCIGAYEGDPQLEYGCDEHCGHGCEDGECVPLVIDGKNNPHPWVAAGAGARAWQDAEESEGGTPVPGGPSHG